MVHAASPGLFLGRFRLQEQIGTGSAGRVYRAEPTDGGAAVAVKLLEPLQTNRELVERFRRGARATASLVHENVARVFEIGEDEGRPYLITELLEGRELFDVLRQGVFSEARATHVLLGICRALGAAHALGVVHRDLKPENVYLVGPGEDQVKVVDFGIAKWVGDGDPGSNAITQLGTVVGTPDYMSPEQCLGEPVDGRSDLYACGVLLFEMLTKKTPLGRATPTLTAAAHVSEPPPSLGSARPGVDPRLEAIVARCLAKQPAGRYASAAELERELVDVLDTPRWASQTGDAMERVTLDALSVAQPSRAGVPRRRLLLVRIVVGLVLLVVVGGVAALALLGR